MGESISAAGIEAGHTPGPWRFAGSEGSRARVEDSKGCLVALTRLAISPAEVVAAQSNARLIAASPTMFDYVARRATAGDAEACEIMEAIHAPR